MVAFRPVTPSMAEPTAIQTERLILEPVAERHRENLIAFLGDPAVMSVRKLGVLDTSAASQVVNRMIAQWSSHGYGMFAVIERDTGAFLGECGLRAPEQGTIPELSYGLLTAARRKGYAREAATATVEHGFGPLGQPTLVAFARGDNAISRRLLESLGFELVGERPKDGYTVVQYEARARGEG